MRGFITFPPDKIGVYLDWRTQEIGVAAALSEDPALMAAYSGGDVYYALAVMCGLTDDPDVKHWKANNKAMRNRMKALQLGINYGMGVPSLARGLDRHPLIASTIIEKHKRTYERYWEWKEERANTAMQDRELETQYGWPLYLSHTPNRRTIYNFPMQGNGAEMLRLAAMRMCEAGIIPSMLVHDAVLLEADSEEQIAQAVEIMERAGADVCNGFKIGVDVERMKIGGRFQRQAPGCREDLGDDHAGAARGRRVAERTVAMTKQASIRHRTTGSASRSRRLLSLALRTANRSPARGNGLRC